MVTSKNIIVKPFIAPKAKVLIVDDSNVTLTIERDIMSSFAMDISTAHSGEECLELLKNNSYDIIFMDIVMPILNGIQATSKIREKKEEHLKNITIIALTASISSNSLSLYVENGFNDYLEKPIKIFELNKILRNYLPKEYIEEITFTEKPAKITNEIKIKNVNTRKAIKNCCGNMDNYLSLLSVAYYDGKNKINIIKDFANNKDIENYTIEVHALKTVAALIGDESLCQLAKLHEIAGTNKDLKFITENVDLLLNKYTTLLSNIEFVITKETTVPQPKIKEFNFQDLITIVTNIANTIDNFDLDSSNKYLNELLEYDLTESQFIILNKIKNLLNVFDYDTAYELITNFKHTLYKDI